MPRLVVGALAVLIGAFALPAVAVGQTGITDYLVTTSECAEWDTGYDEDTGWYYANCIRYETKIVSVGISKKPRLDHDEQSFIDFGNAGATEYCHSDAEEVKWQDENMCWQTYWPWSPDSYEHCLSEAEEVYEAEIKECDGI